MISVSETGAFAPGFAPLPTGKGSGGTAGGVRVCWRIRAKNYPVRSASTPSWKEGELETGADAPVFCFGISHLVFVGFLLYILLVIR